MWEFIKIVLGIFACIFSCGVWVIIYEDMWDWYDLEDVSVIIAMLVGGIAICWATASVWYGFGIIYLIVAVIISVIIAIEGDYSSFHFIYMLIVSILLVFFISAGIAQKNAIAWDMENYETQVVEYPIMGTSGDQIVIKVTDGENTSLKPISMSSMKWQVEEVFVPYVYYETYTYTKYDYSKEPPEVLEKGKQKGSGYILCGSEEQIQDLFGYEVTFNFEQ